MIVNSVNSLRVANVKNYASNNNAPLNSQPVINYADTTSFSGLHSTVAKKGKPWLLIAALPIAMGLATLLTGCDPVIGPTPPVIEQPTEPTLARLTMDAMLQMVDSLGLNSAKSLNVMSARSINNYVPVKGDIQEFGYHDDFNNITLKHNLDTANSTSDKLVYQTTDTDNVYGDVRSYKTEVTKTENGVKFQYEGVDHALEYVVKDGYVMVYKVKPDGTKTGYERQYPGDTPGTVRITAPDGGDPGAASTLSNYNIIYAQ